MSQSAHGAHAPTKFYPNPDQARIRHLKMTVRNFARVSRSTVQLFVNCGNIAFPIQIDGEEVRDFEIGERLIAEYPKENNPLNTPFSAIYPAHMRPAPQKEKPMIDITPAATGDALIPVNQGQIGGATVQTVNARELHAYLEVGKDFSTWIKDRIEQYGFVENQDFVVFTEIGENSKGGRPAKEYALTLDMAKELSMVERNQKGKQARQYFIECERRAKAAALAIPNNLPDALRLAADLAEEKAQVERERDHLALENQAKEEALAVAQPKARALDRISADTKSLTITQAAKVLEVKREELTNWMVENGWIYRQNASWVAYQKHIQAGRLRYKEANYTDEKTELPVTRPYCHITPKGLAIIAQALEAESPAIPPAATQQATGSAHV